MPRKKKTISSASRIPKKETKANGQTSSPPRSPRRNLPFIIGISIGFAVFFTAGVYYGGRALQNHEGFGTGDMDKQLNLEAIQEFVDQRILPAMNDTYNNIMEKINKDQMNNNNVNETDTKRRPGEKFKSIILLETGQQVRPKHPVIFVPGFITGGLQLWAGEECLRKRFRESIWAGNSMASAFLADKECWLRHVELDPLTGMDPLMLGNNESYIKVRAQQGLEAADYFVSSYWIFGKLIHSLADIGYDPNNMDMVTYDWRMAYPLLEERDGFLTDFKVKVERMVAKNNGEKIVLMGHSMGNLVVLFFLRWVVEPKKRGGGGGGSDWVNQHVESFINIAGPMLGVPKAISTLLSGEMKETAVLGTLGKLLEGYLAAKRRKEIISSWASVWSMLPKGGPALWEVGADNSSIPESDSSPARVLEPPSGAFHSMEEVCNAEEDDACYNPLNDAINSTINEFAKKSKASINLDDVLQFLLDYGGGLGPKVAASRYHSFQSGGRSPPILSQWHNPVATPLPVAPSMKIYCMYGVGVDTEAGYAYKSNLDETGQYLDPPFVIDTNATKGNMVNGVRLTNGDGSVPLLSLGYMCADGWINNRKLNPSKIQVITKEFEHEATFVMSDPLRAGPKAGEHCDILGNEELTYDVLKIVTGEKVDTRIISDIKNMAATINSHDLGGLNYISKVEAKR